MTNQDPSLLPSLIDISVHLGMSPGEVIDIAIELGIQLLLEIPEDVTVYANLKINPYGDLSGTPIIEKKVFLSHNDPHTRKLLCLPPAKAKRVLQVRKDHEYQFMHAAIFSDLDKRFYKITPKEFYRCEVQVAFNAAMNTRPFDFSRYNSPDTLFGMPTDDEMESTSFLTLEKPIPITMADLLLRREDLDHIQRSTSAAKPDYGKFEPGSWTSTKLAILNEASTRFFSSANASTRRPDQLRIDEIKDWLRLRWKGDPGTGLLAQAVNIIKPDQFYSGAPSREELEPELLAAHNAYASTTLIIVNETARLYHAKIAANAHVGDWARKISQHLQDEYDLRVQLSNKAATIILPDHMSKT
ncbi:hypothetical protein [Pseudomonas aeruginosa]|uniref:hypothetical protein n=1 Tax=Pseudomonas aeruginosa TaxID=287 RepID=UPI000F6180E7|nr:hypothetical protein [Pseudomonas aeruginosa]MBV6121145.1 hypothetical protein [Pseudomonas aeruginosa]MBV6133388.1 hypothetical protein [Pseudomonas aeruginosa]RRJ06903.1 hypothetical protein EIM04_20805 [Pseudomonas aeruginosa]